jgi:hypothetical protein
VIRTLRPEPLTHKDFRRMGDALLVALDALARNGDQEAIDLVTAVLEGRAKLEGR